MRGRLIQRFRAKLDRLDTAATATASAYDDVFREVVKVDAGGDGIGALDQRYHATEYVPCQIGNRRWERMQPDDLGNDADSDFVVYFHYPDLEAAGLIDATTKRPLIGPGDRLTALVDYWDTSVVVLPFTSPLYCVEATPSGYGLHMARPKLNLIRAVFRTRSPVGSH